MKNLAQPSQTRTVTPAVVNPKVNIVFKLRFLRESLSDHDTILSTNFDITNVMISGSYNND